MKKMNSVLKVVKLKMIVHKIIKKKFELKYDRSYKDIGKTPGVLIEENKRRKLLKELGVE